MNTGRRSRRRRPTIEAVIAARISTPSEPLAEDDDRRVGDDRGLVGGVAERGRRVAELLVEHQPRLADLAPRRALRDLLRQPVAGRARRTRSGPRCRARGPGRTSAAAAPGRTRRTRTPRAAPARPGGTGRRRRRPPSGRASARSGRSRTRRSSRSTSAASRPSARPPRAPRRARRRSCVGTPSLAFAAASTSAAELGRARRRAAAVRARSRLASWSRRSPSAATAPRAERDRLLDLEVARDPVALDAAAVLDRHEREELQQLLCAPRGLLRRERRGGEARRSAASAAIDRLAASAAKLANAAALLAPRPRDPRA